MGKTEYELWKLRHNRLRIVLSEAARAEFVWKGRNRHVYNRLFLVEAGGGEIVNHTGNQRLALEPGRAYFLPLNLDLSFDFRPGLVLRSWHFNLELLPGVDLFQGCDQCRVTPAAEEEFRETAELFAAEPDGWARLARFERLLLTLIDRHTPAAECRWPQLAELETEYAPLLDFIASVLPTG